MALNKEQLFWRACDELHTFRQNPKDSQRLVNVVSTINAFHAACETEADRVIASMLAREDYKLMECKADGSLLQRQ